MGYVEKWVHRGDSLALNAETISELKKSLNYLLLKS